MLSKSAVINQIVRSPNRPDCMHNRPGHHARTGSQSHRHRNQGYHMPACQRVGLETGKVTFGIWTAAKKEYECHSESV